MEMVDWGWKICRIVFLYGMLEGPCKQHSRKCLQPIPEVTYQPSLSVLMFSYCLFHTISIDMLVFLQFHSPAYLHPRLELRRVSAMSYNVMSTYEV
jgi:hypothetical protein